MKMSEDGIDRLTSREGMKLKAYRDVGGVWTICAGHTGPEVKRGMTATMAECKAMLAKDVAKFERCVEHHIRVPMTQHQFDAMVSLAYNIGCSAFGKSSVARHMNAGDPATAADKFLLWNKVKGRTVQGLVNRRKDERRQFLGELT